MAYNTFPAYPQYPLYQSTAYGQQYSQTGQPQYAQQAYQTQQQSAGILWVDGEVGAKAYQMPNGWPANAPIPLWDTNDTVIYLKSINPMGMPNPLQKVHYTMEEGGQQAQKQAALPAPDRMSGHREDYVTRDDLERMKDELRRSITDALAAEQTPATGRKGGRTNESSV